MSKYSKQNRIRYWKRMITYQKRLIRLSNEASSFYSDNQQRFGLSPLNFYHNTETYRDTIQTIESVIKKIEDEKTD